LRTNGVVSDGAGSPGVGGDDGEVETGVPCELDDDDDDDGEALRLPSERVRTVIVVFGCIF